MTTALLILQLALQLSAFVLSMAIVILTWRRHGSRLRILQGIVRPGYLFLMTLRRTSALFLSLGITLAWIGIIDRVLLPMAISFLILIETIFQLYDAVEKWQKWKRNQSS